MKIADGKVMTAEEIRMVMFQAQGILLKAGVHVLHPSWLKIRNWLRTRMTKRDAVQTAQAYLHLLSEEM